MLCFMAYGPTPPWRMVYDATGAEIAPERIWAFQDAVAFCIMHWMWDRTRNPIAAIVGLLLLCQLGVHALRALNGWDWGVVSPYMDRLLEAQLAAIAAQGAWHVGDAVVRGVRDIGRGVRRRLWLGSIAGLGAVVNRYHGSSEYRDHDHALSQQQRGGRG